MEYVIDAENQKLGRLATRIAHVLQGKESPSYERRLSGTDRVVVTNIKKISLAQKKAGERTYYRHTGYMGHLYEKTLAEAFARSPEDVLRNTVRHMLPKNRLQKSRLSRLSFK